MISGPSNMSQYVAFIKHSLTRDNHFKTFIVSEKKSKKILFYLNTSGILHCKNFNFSGQLLSNFFIRFDTIAFRGAFKTLSNIYDRAFCKISQHFFQPLTIFVKTPFQIFNTIPNAPPEQIYSIVVKEKFSCLKEDFLSNLIISISGNIESGGWVLCFS